MSTAYYNFYTNIFFLLPVIAAWYQKEVIYCTLAIAIMIVRTFFHVLEFLSHRYFRAMRRIDVILSYICYSYMIYFSWMYLSTRFMIFAFFGLIVSIWVYLWGRFQKLLWNERDYQGCDPIPRILPYWCRTGLSELSTMGKLSILIC